MIGSFLSKIKRQELLTLPDHMNTSLVFGRVLTVQSLYLFSWFTLYNLFRIAHVLEIAVSVDLNLVNRVSIASLYRLQSTVEHYAQHVCGTQK